MILVLGPDSLSSSAPKDDFKARELLRQATHNNRQSAKYEINPCLIFFNMSMLFGHDIVDKNSNGEKLYFFGF